MEKRTYEEAVEIMIDWWVKKSFETSLNQNNGDDTDTGGMAFLLMNMVSMQAQEKVTPIKIENFKSALTIILLQQEGKGEWANELDVDYHPNENLSKACEMSGVDSRCLPIKTFTRIDKDNIVRGRYQYGGDWFAI